MEWFDHDYMTFGPEAKKWPYCDKILALKETKSQLYTSKANIIADNKIILAEVWLISRKYW